MISLITIKHIEEIMKICVFSREYICNLHNLSSEEINNFGNDIGIIF